jgi:hypothetical protein
LGEAGSARCLALPRHYSGERRYVFWIALHAL